MMNPLSYFLPSFLPLPGRNPLLLLALLASQPLCGQALLYYWNFNDAAAPTTPLLASGPAHLEVMGATPLVAHTEGFGGLNAICHDVAGTQLQINNPHAATLTLSASTKGSEWIHISYETRRTGGAAGIQKLSYSADGVTWQEFRSVAIPADQTVLVTANLSSLAEVRDNESFKFRITFELGNGYDFGNVRFDNLTIREFPEPVLDPPPTHFEQWQHAHFGEEALNPEISGPHADPDADGLPNLMEYALGRDPLHADGGKEPLQIIRDEAGALAFRFDRIADPSLAYSIETSNELEHPSWITIFRSTGSENVAGPVVIKPPPGHPLRPVAFFRLRVTLEE